MPSHRISSSFTQPPDGAFQLGDDEDEEAQFASPAATLSPVPLSGASASPASSVAGEYAESRWVLLCCKRKPAERVHRKPSVVPHTHMHVQTFIAAKLLGFGWSSRISA
jgi:hypothetical protein